MALITCSKCGKRVSDKAKACPHCGSPVKLADSEPVQEEILRNQEPIHQSQSEAESRHLHESQPKPQLQAEPTHDQDDEPKKGKGGLVAILVVALLVLLAGAGWLWYDNSQKQAEMEQQLAIQREQARQDSIAAAELREQARQDSIAKQTLQEQLEKTKSISSLYMDYWGTIGELSLNCFVMKGQEGYYQFSGADNVKRTLKVASYDKSSGRCKLDAYLRGKYIGAFEGIFDEDQASYQGVFISVRGIKLDFDIGIYGD